MRKELFKKLLERYLDGKASEEESRLVEEYYDRMAAMTDPASISEEESYAPEMEEYALKGGYASEGSNASEGSYASEGSNALERGYASKKVGYTSGGMIRRIDRGRRRVRFAAAAVLLLMAAGAAYWTAMRGLHSRNPRSGNGGEQAMILPGTDKAILTLDNGSQVILDTAADGTIATEEGARAAKKGTGQIVYTAGNGISGNGASGNGTSGNGITGNGVTGTGGEDRKGEERLRTAYNTLTTPRGGKYKLTLSDGTDVWLNAASSIRFPVKFTGRERIVEVTGEAYLDVKKDATRPFFVRTGGMEVRVLGTELNVKSYEDERENVVTLVSGSVLVRKGEATGKLQPGQRIRAATTPLASGGPGATGGSGAGLSTGGAADLKASPATRRAADLKGSPATGGGAELKAEADPDLEGTLAWRNDLFSFNNSDIYGVMRQLSRWYDVDVRYEGAVSKHFNGNIERSTGVMEVFRLLQLTGGVHFRIEGRQIVVSP